MLLSFRKVSLLFASILLTASTSIQAASYAVDPNHSTISFLATHLKSSTIPGSFTDFSGTVEVNEKDFTKSKIDFTVNIASITTQVAKRDEHLKTPDFFDAANAPKATFKSTEIKKKSGNNYALTGDLTIRGISKKTTFDMQDLGTVNDPTMKVDKHIFSAKGKINRRDFKINYGTNDIIGDMVDIMINLELVPADHAAAKK